MSKRICRGVCAVAAAAWLTACGGGGGSGGNAAQASPPAATAAALKVTFLPQAITTLATPLSGAAEAFTTVSVTGSQDALYVAVGSTLRGVAIASVSGDYLDAMQIHVTFKEAGALPDGTYTDTVTFEVCTDDKCANQIAGSPFSVPVSYTVSGSSAVAVPTSLSAPTGFLSHDVVDAAISKPLGLVVMASTQPANTLQVVDLATGIERAIALSKPPTSIALSPDGRKVAVGHDQMVSLVDLTAAQPVVREVAVAASVWDLVLADDDIVQAFPAADQWVNVLAVDMDAGTSQASLGQIYAQTRARLHPDGDRLYLLDTLLEPAFLTRYDLAGGVPTKAGAQADPYSWQDCGNFWFSDAGDRIFTACGHVYSANVDPAQDLVHQARLPLIYPSINAWPLITWADDDAAAGELALLDAGECAALADPDCNTMLRVVDDAAYAIKATYWMPPVYRDGDYHVQHGQFVFHAADGSLRVLSRLVGVADATHAWTLDQPHAGGVSVLSAGLRGRQAAVARGPAAR